MSWSDSRDQWIGGRVPPQVDKDEVLDWIRNDPVWKKADKITFEPRGSHEVTIYIRHISGVLPKWSGDVFQVSTVSGRKVKKWIVEQLVKAYVELKGL